MTVATLAGAKDSRRDKMSYKQQFAFAVTAGVRALAAPVAAQDRARCGRAQAAADAGFYGGVSLRQGRAGSVRASDRPLHLRLGPVCAPTARRNGFAARWSSAATAGPTTSRVEAAFATVDRYALRARRPRAASGWRSASSADAPASRSLERRRLHELGIPQELLAVRPAGLRAKRRATGLRARRRSSRAHPRRNRDGVNYGLGLRYDMTPRARACASSTRASAASPAKSSPACCRRAIRCSSACSSASDAAVARPRTRGARPSSDLRDPPACATPVSAVAVDVVYLARLREAFGARRSHRASRRR